MAVITIACEFCGADLTGRREGTRESPVRAATPSLDRKREEAAMSFKSREKKRRRKIAMANARGKADRHYLTPVSRHCCCNRCGSSLRAGRDNCVYRHTPREILCIGCATTGRVPYRLSHFRESR